MLNYSLFLTFFHSFIFIIFIKKCIFVWLNICILLHIEFEWDDNKNIENLLKHEVSFFEAQNAFFDKKRVIAIDTKHCTKGEKRYFCFGLINDKVMTVRFTIRENRIRIFGAGYWREGRKKYEKENSL